MAKSKTKGRKFDGKFYKSFAKTRLKRNAVETARRLRSRGDLVRVVKTSNNFYEVFTRKMKNKRK